MEGLKSVLFSALVLAMLASSTFSVPAMGPSYGYQPQYQMSAEAQQFLNELQQQNNMANDPDGAALLQQQNNMANDPDGAVLLQQQNNMANDPDGAALLQQQNDMANDPEGAALQQAQLAPVDPIKPFVFCYHSLYILAFTSGLNNGGSDDRAYVEMRLKTGETRLIRLYNRPGDDYMRYKGDLWKISLSSFGFSDKCITRYDIDNLALVEGGNDGWNIESVVTFLKRGSYYRLLSRDFNVYRWLDGNGQLSHLRFDLNLV